MSDEPKCGPCADGRPCADHPRPPVSDQTSSPETWVCRASHVAYGYCTSPVGVLPGHGACGPAVPPAPTPEPPLSIADSDDPSPWADHPPTPSPVSPEDGEGVRSQTEQWFVVHHNQIRALRFAQFPIERLARASIAACTCGPHTLRHTVITTYTASDETEFVAARPSGAVS